MSEAVCRRKKPAWMAKALSLHLRSRVLAAVAAGASHRLVAARFGIVPEFRSGDTVVIDTLSNHKSATARALVEAAGASRLLLPPYSLQP